MELQSKKKTYSEKLLGVNINMNWNKQIKLTMEKSKLNNGTSQKDKEIFTTLYENTLLQSIHRAHIDYCSTVC